MSWLATGTLTFQNLTTDVGDCNNGGYMQAYYFPLLQLQASEPVQQVQRCRGVGFELIHNK